MIALDNIIFELQGVGGVSAVWRAVIEAALRDSDLSGQLRFYDSGRGGTNRFYPEARRTASGIVDDKLPLRLRRYTHVFARNVAVFHSSYFRVHNSRSVKNVVTIHDCIYEQFDTGLAKLVHLGQKRHALKRAAAVICVSEHTRQDLFRYYPWLDPERVRVVHNGVAYEFFVSADAPAGGSTGEGAAEPYFLYVGGRGIHKNFAAALHLLASRTAKQLNLSLVVVGAQLSPEENRLASQLGVTHRIAVRGGVDVSELAGLYSGAYFFLFPSLYEGFGIPPLEAMAAGCPVICTNAAALPEVVGDAALLFPPKNREAATEQLDKLADSEFRKALIAKGRTRAREFS